MVVVRACYNCRDFLRSLYFWYFVIVGFVFKFLFFQMDVTGIVQGEGRPDGVLTE